MNERLLLLMQAAHKTADPRLLLLTPLSTSLKEEAAAAMLEKLKPCPCAK